MMSPRLSQVLQQHWTDWSEDRCCNYGKTDSKAQLMQDRFNRN